MTLRRNRRVRQTTFEARPQVSQPLSVSQLTGAVAVVELIQVPVQMLRFNVNVCTLQTALQLREVVLAHVRAVRLVSAVDSGLVVYGIVTSHLRANGNVTTVRVSVKRGCCHVNVGAKYITQGLGIDVRNDLRAYDVRVRVNDGNSWRLVSSSTALYVKALASVTVAGVAANVRLVAHNIAAEQNEVIVAHGHANSVEHVPRGTRAQPVLALDLACSDAVLGTAQFEHDHDPRTHRNLRRVHNGSGQHRELLATRVALPHTSLRLRNTCRRARRTVGRFDVANVSGRALRALRLTLPAQVLEVPVGVGLGNNLAAQAGNRCLHASIFADGCDIPNDEFPSPMSRDLICRCLTNMSNRCNLTVLDRQSTQILRRLKNVPFRNKVDGNNAAPWGGIVVFCGGGGPRTPDLLLDRQSLYQLSCTPCQPSRYKGLTSLSPLTPSSGWTPSEAFVVDYLWRSLCKRLKPLSIQMGHK